MLKSPSTFWMTAEDTDASLREVETRQSLYLDCIRKASQSQIHAYESFLTAIPCWQMHRASAMIAYVQQLIRESARIQRITQTGFNPENEETL